LDFALKDTSPEGSTTMNKAINSAELKPAVTTGPLPSAKIFVTPDEGDVRVPLREIILSEGAASRTCRCMTPRVPTPILMW